MPREKPVEKGSARSADVQIAGRRGGEPSADFRAHLIVILSESEGSRKSSVTCEGDIFTGRMSRLASKLLMTSMETNTITGGCYCGEVRFSASSGVRARANCHC